MKSLKQSIKIKGPINSVFEALADPNNQMKFDNEMMRSCEKITDGPIEKGTRFRGNFKGMGIVEYGYSEFKQNSIIEHAVKMPFGSFHHRFNFEASNDETVLTQTINLELNLLGKVMWPLMMKNMMTKRIKTLNVLIKQYIETQK